LDSNIEGLKKEYEFKPEIRSSQIRTSFNNPRGDYACYTCTLSDCTAVSMQLCNY